MSLKCHFDSDGWLQGSIKITHMTSPNHYTSGFSRNARGLVQHTEDGYEAGTIATFMSPAAQVSAFFGVDEDGTAQQFLPVGHGFVAWAQVDGNQDWRSCECEDKTKTGQPMTQPQMVAFAQILEACSAYDHFPLQITDDPVNGHGLITHGDGGVAWGDHPDCPGSVRKAQRPHIIALAMSIRAEGTPAPPAKPATVQVKAPAAPRSVPIEIQDDSVVISAVVNGKPVSFVLDTGDAIGPTFTAADASRLGLVKGAPFGVEGAGGASSAYQTTADITFDDLAYAAEPSAIDDDLEGSSLLGLPFFLAKAAVLSFDLAARTLSMTPLAG